MFINQVLPKLYKSNIHTFRNNVEFDKSFHSEGRRRYDLQVRLNEVNREINSVLNITIMQPLET